MTAESILGLIFLVFTLGWVAGYLARGHELRTTARRRVKRVHGLYAGVREW